MVCLSRTCKIALFAPEPLFFEPVMNACDAHQQQRPIHILVRGADSCGRDRGSYIRIAVPQAKKITGMKDAGGGRRWFRVVLQIHGGADKASHAPAAGLGLRPCGKLNRVRGQR